MSSEVVFISVSSGNDIERTEDERTTYVPEEVQWLLEILFVLLEKQIHRIYITVIPELIGQYRANSVEEDLLDAATEIRG